MANNTPDEEAKLVSENLGLVFKHVKSFVSKSRYGSLSDVDDFFQAGCIGLLKAIRKYDPNRGKLSTIAWISILQEIIKEKKKDKKQRTITNQDIELLASKNLIKPSEKIEDFLPESSIEGYNIVLYRVMGMSFKEISVIVDQPINKIKSTYNKIRKKIVDAEQE